MSQVFPALHTLTASRWTLFLVRLLGRKYVTQDGGWQITSAHWRGKIYMLDFREVAPVNNSEIPF